MPDAPPRVPLAERALARRVREVPPSGIRRFFDIAATMDDVISLGIGEPDFDTPKQIVEAGVQSLREGRTHYTSNYGTLELRQALSDHLEARYGVRYDPAREILVTVGASEAVDLALRATCDPGDEVILHEPSYVAYSPAITFSGGSVAFVSTRLENDFALDPADIEAAITPRTKALFLGYPCNPTGAVLPADVLDEIARIAVRHDLLVYSDEIYDRLAYGSYSHRAVPSLPGMRERTILMGGFSKAYAMTGWRVGFLCAPAAILEGIVKVHQYGIMSAGTTAQDGALERRSRSGEPDVQRMLAELRPPPADPRRRPERARPPDLRAARRVLRLPADHLDGALIGSVRRRAAHRGARRVRPGRCLRTDRARDTSACATQPARRRSARHWSASDASSSAVARDGHSRRPDASGRPRALRGRHRHRDPLPAEDGEQDVLWLLHRLRRRGAEQPLLSRVPWAARRAADDQPARRRARPRDRPRDRRDRSRGDTLGSQELLLPDLPKGYQISQYDLPLASGAARPRHLRGPFTVPITRAHLEEDTAKLIHATGDRRIRVSLVDFNRSGAPLMEIVTEPDIRTAEQARRYAEELQLLMRAIGASDAEMENGQMRVEANVSLRPRGTEPFGTRVEVKNMNSFRSVERAIVFEIERQAAALDAGELADDGDARLGRRAAGHVPHAAQGAERRLSLLPRARPAAAAHRLRVAGRQSATRSRSCRRRDARGIATTCGLSAYDAAVIVGDPTMSAAFEAVVAAGPDLPVKEIANLVTGDYGRHAREIAERGDTGLVGHADAASLADLVRATTGGSISRTNARDVLAIHLRTGRSARDIIAQEGFAQISDTGALDVAVEAAITANPAAVADYRAGKSQAIGFLVGQVMKATRGQANAGMVGDALRRRLDQGGG